MGDDRRGSKRQRTESGNELCRDYNKGTCFRGSRCKFAHPKDEDLEGKRIPFCKDFRYSTCRFRDCLYVHAPELLEKEYLSTGWVPRFVLKHCLERFNLCIQFMKGKGDCDKSDCKYGHSLLGLDLELKDFDFSSQCNHGMSTEQLARQVGLCLEYIKDNCTEEDCKYKHLSPHDAGVGNANTSWSLVREREGNNGYIRPGRGGGLLDNVEGGFQGQFGGGCGGGDDVMMVRRENEMLRMEIMELRKKNEGLQATNQFLLEENANMRMKQQAGGGGSPSSGGYNGGQAGGYSNYGPSSSGGYGGATNVSSGYGGYGGTSAAGAYGGTPAGGYGGAAGGGYNTGGYGGASGGGQGRNAGSNMYSRRF